MKIYVDIIPQCLFFVSNKHFFIVNLELSRCALSRVIVKFSKLVV